MIPKSISASSLHVAELCLARYKAEHIDRGKGMSGDAASLGTTVHAALEMYVQTCIMTEQFPATLKQLLEFFKMQYMVIMGGDFEDVRYTDGVQMLKDWHKRTDFDEFTVVSSEIKSSFSVPTTIGPLTFNYIWDRFDQVGETEYRVVDYKTNVWGINPGDLKKKLQARAYGMAAAIQLKNEGKEVTRIWVEFDMLRHAGPVGIVFSRDDNAATYTYIKGLAQKIVDTDPDHVEETLNAECNFCPRKLKCGALQRNLLVGGVSSIASIEEAIDLRAMMEWQKKGLASALAELDQKILTEARERDEHQFESDNNRLKITVSSQRKIDPERAEMVLGDELFRKYGGRSFTVGNFDKLMKGDEITADQKKKLKSLVYSNSGEPSVKIESLNPLDGD